MLPIAVLQSCMFWLTHCYRGQAPSHIWISVDQIDPDLLLLLLGLIADLILEAESGQKCGRELAPDSGASIMHVLADTLLSGQAPSHIWISMDQIELIWLMLMLLGAAL